MRVDIDGKVRLHNGMLYLAEGVNTSKMDISAGALTPHFQLAFVIKDQKAVQYF